MRLLAAPVQHEAAAAFDFAAAAAYISARNLQTDRKTA